MDENSWSWLAGMMFWSLGSVQAVPDWRCEPVV
jgi:hypothetical protein